MDGKIMINNDLSKQLDRYFTRPAQSETGGQAAELYKRLKSRQDAIAGRNDAAEEKDKKTETKEEDKDTVDLETGKEKDKKTAAAKTDEKTISPEEKRRMELQSILDKINAEEAARYPDRAAKAEKTEKKEENSGVITPEMEDDALAKLNSGGLQGFLNDMPLFSEFKKGLIDAFNKMDSASSGFISAQYELNFSSMQYIADAANGGEYRETSLSIKLDLNYIKAAAGKGTTGKEIADILSNSEEFPSLMESLSQLSQNGASQTQQKKTLEPQDILSSLKDYFSPEKTADRILDFSTAFFPNSTAFKAKGDTEEARNEFAETMRKAIQKGFDQAMGTLGSVPKSVQDGIDKTHDLVFKGIDDFIKNGMNRKKQEDGVYSSLEQFAFSFEMSYTQKSYSVSSSSAAAGAYAAAAAPATQQPQQTASAQPEQKQTQPAMDVQA